MKILLAAINAKYIHSNLGIYSLKAYAKSYEAHLELAEYTINHNKELILEDVFKRSPDVLAISCYIWNLEYVIDFVENFHKICPEVPIWLGGPEVSYDSELFLEKHLELTGIMRGEGEEIFRSLAEHYIEKNLELGDIKGITYRTAENVIRQNPPAELLAMDDLPFCYDNIEDFQNRIIYYETSRGCPFSCSYCLSSVERNVRFRSMELVKRELQFFIEHKVPQVKFVDRTFNCRHSHAMAVWRYVKEHDNGLTNFHFEISADLLKEDEIELLASLRPGLVQLEIGVQSTNPKTLEAINRRMDFGRLSEVVRRIREGQNIHQHLDLIAGLPYEDLNSFICSFNEVYALQPDQLQLGFLKLLKGSEMHYKAEAYGIGYRSRPVYEVLYTNWISYADIVKLKAVEEMTEVYYNSGQFANTLKVLIKQFPHPFSFYEELADYYEKNGLNGMSHTRMKRYEILLDFIKQKKDSDIEMYKELLTYDLYLRENLKSRPEWSRDLTSYKERFWNIYKREEREPEILKDYEGYTFKQMSKMTHLEVFRYDVTKEYPNPKECFLLFDYKHRNPLNSEAAVFEIKDC